MLFLLRYFIKRIPRERFKSLTVPALALVLVVLISVLGDLRRELMADLEHIIDTFPIRVEVSTPFTSETNNLTVGIHYIRLFTDPDISSSISPTLAPYLTDVELRQSIRIKDDTDAPPFISNASLVGITSIEADARLDPITGAYIVFFDDYDESLFRSSEHLAVVSQAVYDTLDPYDPVFRISLQNREVEIEAELTAAGIIHGGGNNVYAPFWVVSELGLAIDIPVRSEIMSALICDNRLIADFMMSARQSFSRVGQVTDLPFSLVVYDSTYNEVTDRLRQNILLVDVTTPFIYVLSALVGFITSYTLTLRRMPELAVIRSIGINKKDVFSGVLMEQTVLCLSGAVMAFILFSAVRGQLVWLPPILFTLCYSLGSVISAEKAAGADVLKLLRERE